jgi:hypothetical protein
MEMLTFKQFLDEKHCWKGYVKRGMKKKGNRMVNNCVKEDTENRPILGVVEEMIIDGVGKCLAKIDSGNEAYNVLHGVDIVMGDKEFTCTTLDEKQIRKPLISTIQINIGSGIKEERPVTTFDIVLDGKTYKNIPFSISDRTENEEKVLVGEPFIRDLNALIDVDKK